ncbi:L-threonylcarbamoyladenylate synthase [Mycoplasmoides alvi]|uniref:L-threonylcarbamoyladenylate synthase n=1 Tax=Mycoplasmoides alvi TaxID=78580 RepID=UPI000696896B|nr:Sua5/YciO/YrdC/YwlC family protein [Mycoplasmoides alvi]
MQVYEPNEIDEIVYELKSGRAILIETDTQIGIVSIDPKLIYFLKKRPKHKKLIRFISDPYQVKTKNKLFYQLANHFWPGQITLIVNKIAYRIPNHPILLQILKQVNFLYSSSANISSMKPLENTLEAFSIKHFVRNEIDLVIVNGKSNSSIPSTIFNVDSGKIIRKGNMYNELVNFLKENGIKYDENLQKTI